jgi:hypothetical protein
MPDIKTKSLDAAPGQVKVWKARLVETGPEVTLIRVPISSTTEDRDGDEFSLAGLESMLAGLKSGKAPLYLDHGFRESGARLYGALDMLGAWIDGEIEGGTLYGTAFLDPDNWLAMELARKIEAGLPVGFSVGFGIVKSRSKDNGGLIFDEVSLWEVSAVGIPSNPDAVNSVALAAVVKALRVKVGLESDMKRKTKETEEEPTEEEEEEQKQTPETSEEEEEEKVPEDEPAEGDEEEDEEKSVAVFDEAAIRQMVAEEVGKALAPVLEALKGVSAEVKTFAEKAVATKAAPRPRGIVVVKQEEQKNTAPAKSQYTPMY